MSADIVQAQYENLDKVAAGFGRAAQAGAELRGKVVRGAQALERGGWEGRGAQAFSKEMSATVYPAMERMIRALEEARTVTLQIKEIMWRAEEEASGRFKGGSAGGGAGGAGSLPAVVPTPAGTFDGRRAAYQVSAPQEVADYAFTSGKAAALKYTVTIEGRAIDVYMPKNPADPAAIHSTDQIARGLAALPESSRNLVTRVNVEPAANPKDADWAVAYNDPNFSSYMTAGKAGVVSVYPQNPQMTQDYLDGTMHHETGHTLSMQKWGEDESDARWNDWKAASKSDRADASQYAQNSPHEDFAETYQLYFQVKGTPEEAEARQRFPNRFQIIDDIVAGRR